MNNYYYRSKLFLNRLSLILLFFVVQALPLFSQYYPSSFYTRELSDTSQDHRLLLRIENSNFLKNNEYFNDIVQGYTLIGYFLRPKLVYYPSDCSKIEAGVHLLKYSGIDNFSKVLPILSFSYQAGKSVEIVMGTLKGTTNHMVVEPLLSYEKYFTENIENGLQFIIHTKFYEGDIWINWQEFIFKGDSNQERFTAGFSNRLYLVEKTKKHSISIPVQSVFVHQGGQINETNEPVLSFNNSAIGLNYSFRQESGFFKRLAFEPLFVFYSDMNSNHQLPYKKGYGIYNQLYADVGDFTLKFAQWHGNSFSTFVGDPIFQSQSTINPLHSEKLRDLLTFRLIYEKNSIRGLDLGVGLESLYDIRNGYFDYWYMFYLNFSKDFFIRKLKN